MHKLRLAAICFGTLLGVILTTHLMTSGRLEEALQPDPGSVWQLTWADEFNSPNGSVPDPTWWTMSTGGAWGEHELQYYTNRPINARQENGALLITAIQEDYSGNQYTSARIETRGKFEQRYGRFEARIKLPSGQGIWPAFWMLGNNIDSVNWPQCGEIDVMENLGNAPSTIYGSVHGPSPFDSRSHITPAALPQNPSTNDGYHLFAVEWESNVIRFSVDGFEYSSFSPQQLFPGETWVYDHPFFIILNIAVGGTWPGNPDKTTVFPQTMFVDYIRVYKKFDDIQR